MTQLILALPGYSKEVSRRLQASEWLTHNFCSSDPDGVYNPANYIQNIKLEEMEYRANLDLNVLQFAVNCVKKQEPKEEYRNACAMLLFCRMADIQIEPALALYERINYGDGNVDEALDDLALLRALDNADPDLLAEYMLGSSGALQSVTPFAIDREETAEDLTRYRRLINWDSIYVLVLGAVLIHWNPAIPPSKRLERYLDWVIREFRLSLPCLVYAGRLYGKSPLPKMMKYRPDASVKERRSALSNMTWDLFIIDHYFRNWTDRDKTWEEILFTQDKALRTLLRLAIRIQYESDVGPLLEHLRSREVATCRELLDGLDSRDDRIYGTDAWSAQHRTRLIEKLEASLGLPCTST